MKDLLGSNYDEATFQGVYDGIMDRLGNGEIELAEAKQELMAITGDNVNCVAILLDREFI